MDNILSTADIVIFFVSLAAIMGVGLWAGRKEETSDDYFLAGRSTRWWGVAGSIFGSNVSANHIVGMMGVGFAVGFAQSHFEISAIAGLLLLCYGFLPVYRKLNIYTLSEYLSRRYNDSCRIAYVLIMLVVIIVIQMVPGFYIGSRSLNSLMSNKQPAKVNLVVANGQPLEAKVADPGLGYEMAPELSVVDAETGDAIDGIRLEAEVVDGSIASVRVLSETELGVGAKPAIQLNGGLKEDSTLSPGDVDPTMYKWGIVLMALVTGTYTIVGGLKAVIVTDVVQSVLLLVAGLIVAFLTFSELGGWGEMVARDAAMAVKEQRLHLYNPPSHPKLPWTGVVSGLMVLHFYYWGTNQFIVQRALAARSDKEARYGILAAGFFKLLIPFFSIGTGIAAYYLFKQNGQLDSVDQDEVFTRLLTDLVAPIGMGLVGIVAAGMIGAILSSLDSMMNSAATILTFDVYKRYINPKASEQRLVWFGRICIVLFIVGSAGLTILTMDPNNKDSFFLQIAEHQSKLVAGVVVAFGLGMLWPRANGIGALVAIIVGVAVSYSLPIAYASDAFPFKATLAKTFGNELNFMHSVFVAALAALVAHVVISLLTSGDKKKAELTWVGLGIFKKETIGRFVGGFLLSVFVYIILALLMVFGGVPQLLCASLGLAWTWVMFAVAALRGDEKQGGEIIGRLIRNDRFWAGLLAGLAIFMMYAFY